MIAMENAHTLSNQTQVGLSGAEMFEVRVGAVTREAADILSFELVHSEGADLPAFTAGAHIDVHLANGLIRQYSLCSNPADRRFYQIAVLKERLGRGGSELMHLVKGGDRLTISAPRNNFPLAGFEANFHLLLAGGIGITPMMAMIYELEARHTDYLIHYCTQTAEKTAFLDRLTPRIKTGHVMLHHDGGDPSKGLDIAKTLAGYIPTKHVYVCGPRGFMGAAKAAAGSWPPHCVHFEHFVAKEATEEEMAWDAKPFRIKIKKTGRVIDVPAKESIVSALRGAGYAIETSCEEGICGTCITRYLEGEPLHRDTVLDEEGRRTHVMICRARSKSPVLVLDI